MPINPWRACCPERKTATLDNPRKDTLCMFYIEHGEFKKAAQIYQGMADTYPNAADQLGMLHFNPTGSFKKDIPRSIEFFETAAKQGHVLSAAHLALIYPIPEYHNYEKAFHYSKYAPEALMLLRQMDDLKI